MLFVGGWPGSSHKSWRGSHLIGGRRNQSPHPPAKNAGRMGHPASRTKASDRNVPSTPLRAGSFGSAQGRPTRSVCGACFRDLVNCALGGAQRNRNVHGLIGIVYVYNNRSATLGDQNVFSWVNHFDEHTVRTVAKRGNCGV